MVREDAGDVDAVVARLSQILELDDEDLNRAMTEMKRSPPFLPITIEVFVAQSKLSDEQALIISDSRFV